eukprot:CAMPEP_0202734704 /NCGR_PEP_ID=MMETSP1385-20130828/188825_1 /ASSEMBLY_ACC=CAM_ASM_000861 /TAXON_ID=933848 /ORGANISM="Elphidium margaritaceum" /LENGTH=387 /DNA_ID=CAMNT_0049401085 /DNA_START=27 /DNA_END=1191 /DNA_ORIENTATION=-
MSKETDPLRKWMKAKGVWQLDLSKLLENEDVTTLDSFRQMDKAKVLELIGSAKKTGFMHGAKLKELHGGFPKKKKKAKPVTSKPAETKPKAKDPADLKREARKDMEKYMRSKGIWQIDLFDLMTDTYEIYSPGQFEEYRADPEWVDTFLTEAQHCGVMGKQAVTLAQLCGKAKKKKKKAKPDANPAIEQKEKQIDPEDLKREARPVMEKYLRDKGVWKSVLYDLMADKYGIYSPDEFEEYVEDPDWADEFFIAARQVCGFIGAQAENLKALCGKKKKKAKKKCGKKKKKAKKKVKKAPVSQPKQAQPKPKDPEEIKMEARAVMEPFMNKNGFWNKDLFLILLEWDVHQPSALADLSKQDRKEVLSQANRAGLIGQKIQAFKSYLKTI